MIHQKISFLLGMKIWHKARQSVQRLFLLLFGLSVVRFWFLGNGIPFPLSFFLFLSDVYVQGITVTELNAKWAPRCVWSSTRHPSAGHRDSSYLISEMTFLHSSSKIAIYVNHPGTPLLPMTMSMDLNFLLTLGWEGYLFDSSEWYLSLSYRKVYFPRNFPCDLKPNLTFLL